MKGHVEDPGVGGSAVGGVYRDILDWAAPLPRWQQELLRRVLTKTELSSDDVEELCAAAVAESELQTPPYQALSAADVPTVAAPEESVRLLAVGNVRNVNVLRPGQELTFGPQLTVIYGDNASGKSGYGRILKKVYRARVVEEILSDVRAEAPPTGRAAATFVVQNAEGGEDRVEWTDGDSVTGVGRFTVLDSACALTYVRGGALEVGPAGIDVPHRFAVELDRVKTRLGSLATATQPKKEALRRLENDTEAGRFIKSLSSTTTADAIAAATSWAPEQASRLQELDSLISQAASQSLATRRSTLVTRSKALKSLASRVGIWIEAVSPKRVDDLKATVSSIADADAAVAAVRALGDQVVPEERLQGPAWAALLTAAARYVETLGGDGDSSLSTDGRCVLCWQKLEPDASARLARFQQHLEGAAEKVRQGLLQQRDTLLAAVRQVPDSLAPEAESLVAQTDGLASRLRDLVAGASRHRDEILAYVKSGVAGDLAALDEDVLTSIRSLLASTDKELASLPASDADAEAERSRLINERDELSARRAVSEVVEAVREFVAKTAEYQRITAAAGAINTRAASNKANELHLKHMTGRYAELVDAELKELRFRRRKPILVQKTNKAKVEVTPLVSPELKHLSPEKVFSEGERTAISLACFLAELQLGDDGSGLIFDDPVSSLDHHVREHVARRLVAAAKDRQVIVFTHDLAFLADLREQAKKVQSVNCTFRTLTATDYEAGFVEEEEPFGARNVKKRLRELAGQLRAAEKAARAGELANMRSLSKEFYEGLRSTWERVVEERLFAEVVQRLERNVVVGALSKVAYSTELGEKVHEGWRRCSAAIEAHDHAPAAGVKSYSIETMGEDLQMLVEVEKSTSR